MKLRKISDITAALPFTEFDFMQKYRESFAVSELWRIYAQLPLKEMAEKIRLAFSQKGIFLCRKRSVDFWEFKVFLDNLYLFLPECFAVRGKWVNFVFGGFAVCVFINCDGGIWSSCDMWSIWVTVSCLDYSECLVSRSLWNYWIIFGFCNG